jgi:hypothetical protein
MVFFIKERVRRRKEEKEGVSKNIKRGVWREY